MKTLIVYYSFTQNNEKLAAHLQRQLNCDIAPIETTRKRTGLSIFLDLLFRRKPAIKPIRYNLRGYGHVIFVAPIWAGKIAMPMKSFLINETNNINDYSFITLCGGRPGQKEQVEKELVDTLHKMPVKMLELWVNDLLPPGKKDTIKQTTGFRIPIEGLEKFDDKLRDFIKEENLVNSI